MATIRQQIIAALSREALAARDLSRMLGIREKEVFEHLPHIKRSLSADGRRLVMTPAECLSCGHVFVKRDRLNKPGRCHRCKSERISEPLFEMK